MTQFKGVNLEGSNSKNSINFNFFYEKWLKISNLTKHNITKFKIL